MARYSHPNSLPVPDLYRLNLITHNNIYTVFHPVRCCRTYRMRPWLLLLLLAWCTSGALGQRPTPNKRHDVYIAGFFPFGGRVSGSIPEGRVGRGVMPAVKLAVDHINENPTLLRNYRLHVWWNDTQVSHARTRPTGPHARPSAICFILTALRGGKSESPCHPGHVRHPPTPTSLFGFPANAAAQSVFVCKYDRANVGPRDFSSESRAHFFSAWSSVILEIYHPRAYRTRGLLRPRQCVVYVRRG